MPDAPVPPPSSIVDALTRIDAIPQPIPPAVIDQAAITTVLGPSSSTATGKSTAGDQATADLTYAYSDGTLIVRFVNDAKTDVITASPSAPCPDKVKNHLLASAFAVGLFAACIVVALLDKHFNFSAAVIENGKLITPPGLANLMFGWLATTILLVAGIAAASYRITGRCLGALIDSRNRISLSQLQVILWTIVLFGAYLAAALWNASHGYAPALDIGIPSTLWIAAGISLTSLVGTPMILGGKSEQLPNPQETADTMQLLSNKGITNADNCGQVMVNKCPGDAKWSDILRGDETGNGAHIDVSKLQMLYLTAILVIAYAITVGQQFLQNHIGRIADLPTMSPGMVAILGLSHAGYLGYKAAPHSQTGP